MSDYICKQHAQAVERIKERIVVLDAEIAKCAADEFADVVHRHELAFKGASRRHLTDRMIERLALEHVLAAHNAALEQALEGDRKRREYEERTVKPRLEAEAKRDEIRRREEAELATIAQVLDRVKACRPRVQKPSAADVAFLRRHTIFSDRYNAPGSVVQLLAEIDQRPWWREGK